MGPNARRRAVLVVMAVTVLVTITGYVLLHVPGG
jgi:uncharacterized PurR-regulated membrane protein YhhQ (DUF165 family)